MTVTEDKLRSIIREEIGLLEIEVSSLREDVNSIKAEKKNNANYSPFGDYQVVCIHYK